MSSDLVKRLRDVQTRERILGFGGSETLLLFSTEAADRIEALEGEVADSLPWKLFYKDGLDLGQIGERLNVDPYSLSPWLYTPLLKQQGHPYESALKAAEARAERLRVALEAARLFIVDQYSTDENADSGEWLAKEAREIYATLCKALEDDKQ